MQTQHIERALYLGSDEPMLGIYHGKRYDIRIDILKSGRNRVTVLDSSMSPVRFTYKNEKERTKTWKKAPEASPFKKN